jgi:hypothetical protein
MLERWRNDPEYRALVTETAQEQWQKPEFRVLMIEVLKAARRKQLAQASSSNEKIPPKL